jgi:hypothetical protein
VDGSAHGWLQLDGDAAVHEEAAEASGGVLVGARRLEQRSEQRLAWSGKRRKQPLLLDEGLQRIRAGINRHTLGSKCTWGRCSLTSYGHRPCCHKRMDGDRCVRLSGGSDCQVSPSSIQISKIFNIPNFEIQNEGLANVQNSPNFAL